MLKRMRKNLQIKTKIKLFNFIFLFSLNQWIYNLIFMAFPSEMLKRLLFIHSISDIKIFYNRKVISSDKMVYLDNLLKIIHNYVQLQAKLCGYGVHEFMLSHCNILRWMLIQFHRPI